MIEGKVRRPLIFGEVLFDRFPDGSVVLGGAPFNVAWNLRALGLDPLLVSRVGEDELGGRILDAMADWGLDTTAVQRDPRNPTGTVEVTLEEGEPRYEITAGCAYDFIAAEELPSGFRGGSLYHGSLALRTEASRLALDRLRTMADGPTLMDVNLRDPWWNPDLIAGWVAAATWVKLNEDELASLVPQESGVEKKAARLLGQGDLRGVVVTRGPFGAYACGRDGWALEEGPVTAPRLVDTVGAGDAFSSVMLLGLAESWPWKTIVIRAQEFAASIVGLRGATTNDPSFYRSFREEWTSP